MKSPVTTDPPTRRRGFLSRERIFQAGLDHVDERGLEALSLHKLGERLGVKAMSLYNHIDGKDDLLTGIVECLWLQVERRQATDRGWRAALEQTTRAIRDVILAHPSAARLLVTRPVLPVPALRAIESVLEVLREAGFSEQRAVDVVRLFVSHAIGSTLAEICWDSCADQVEPAVPSGLPDSLAAVAAKVCDECDPAAMFDLGLELMLRGLDPS